MLSGVTKIRGWGGGALGALVVGVLLGAPLSWGGGIPDNESPFNAPKNPETTGDSPSTYHATDDPSPRPPAMVVVHAAPGSLVDLDTLDPFGAQLVAEDSFLFSVGPEGNGKLAAPEHDLVVVAVATGNAATAAETSDSAVRMQGDFRIASKRPLALRPAAKQTAKQALIAFGDLNAAGTDLAVVERVIALPLQPGKSLQLTKLAELLATFQVLHGTGVAVLVTGTAVDTATGLPHAGIEARAVFEVGPSEQPSFYVDTTL